MQTVGSECVCLCACKSVFAWEGGRDKMRAGGCSGTESKHETGMGDLERWVCF